LVDLAIARSGVADRLLYGDGNGGFTVDPAALPESDSDSRGIAVADIDGDGVDEIIVASFGASVAAYARDSARSYEDRSFLLLPSSDPIDATGLVAADWNGDCEADLAFATQASPSWVSEPGALVVETALGEATEVLVDDLLGLGDTDVLVLGATTLRWWRR